MRSLLPAAAVKEFPKNIKEFCGKPIITYSISAANESGVFDEVMVSTDSEEIAEIARQYGAKIPFMRSEAASNDFATTADVLEEVVLGYKRLGQSFETFACIYPTAPFVTGRILRDAMSKLDESTADSLITVVRYSFPPQRAFVVRNGRVSYQYPEYESARSQDLEPIYHDCGQFYICRKEAFLKYRSLITPDTRPFLMSEDEVQDIDTMTDWEIAETKYQVLHKKGYINV